MNNEHMGMTFTIRKIIRGAGLGKGYQKFVLLPVKSEMLITHPGADDWLAMEFSLDGV